MAEEGVLGAKGIHRVQKRGSRGKSAPGEPGIGQEEPNTGEDSQQLRAPGAWPCPGRV